MVEAHNRDDIPSPEELGLDSKRTLGFNAVCGRLVER